MRNEQVQVRPALPADRVRIEGLLQFYVYDFSEIEPPGSQRIEFNAIGRYDVLINLDPYFDGRAGFHALMIFSGERLAGFALVNTLSHRGATIDHNMGEFFVARKYRRLGIGREALRQILSLCPGSWEVAVLERNAGALAFWPRSLEASASVSSLTKHEGFGEEWPGPIWSFEARA